MNKLTRVILVSLTTALLLALSIPVIAQEGEQPGPGEGEAIISPNFGADVATLNPFLSNDGTSNTVIIRLYPSFIGIDPDTAYFAEGAAGALVTGWDISEDGRTYTFTLRDDWAWSDGTPITSADVVYAWEVLTNPDVNVSGSYSNLVENAESVTAIDDYTVEVVFTDAVCTSLDDAAIIPIVPSHIFREQFPNPADMNDSAFNLTAPVTANAFQFLDFAPGEQVTLVADPNYPDAYAGYVIPEGWIFKNVADQTIQVEQFLAGQLTLMAVPAARQQELTDLVNAGELQGVERIPLSTRFISLNIGDPNNPQPGADEEGNPIDQGIHPIFGDVRVRQALNYAMEFEAINESAFFGFGIQGATHSTPNSWAYPQELEPYPYDTAQAEALLEEAGWVDTDGDGIRNCQNCLYATEVDPSFEGSPLEFELLTNAGNTSQEALGTILQDQWGQVGFQVNFQPIDFNVLVDTLTAQTYDAIMIFWGFSFPDNPDDTAANFTLSADVPGEGFNTQSYYNPRVEELLDQARTLPGCDQAERAELYQEVFQILHEETPWIWVGSARALTVVQPWVEGFDPRPAYDARAATWNEDAWVVDAP
jgi:peptide/nickel transport system substrate-binding protein